MYHILLIFMLFLFITVPTHAARLALIIGNADYQKVPSLDNPVNDAKDMAAELKKLGFVVRLETNASKRTMTNAVRQFGQQLHNGDVGLFYYSGHGMQFNRRNYLVPPEANIQTGADIEFEGLDASFVLAQMEQANRRGVNLMILDACRDNPYKTNVKSLKKGLAKMQSPMGSLIAYATAPDLASYGDSNTRNSIYTQYLLEALRQKAHLSILDMLTEVTAQVTKRTKNKQIPWQASSLTQRFCFAQCGSWQSNIPPKPDFSRQLATCEIHLRDNRLTTGRGGTALSCYEGILKQDSTNTKALAGLTQIENKYVAWIENALQRGQIDRAKSFLASLRTVNPESPKIVEFEEQMQPARRPSIPIQLTPKPPPQPELSSPPILELPQLPDLHDLPLAAFDDLPDIPQTNPLSSIPVFRTEGFRERLKDGNLGPEMVVIPAGRFRMGDIQGDGWDDKKPVHWVNVKPFAMGKYEVTFAEYDKFANATGRKKPNDNGWGRGNRPVIIVSWDDAVAYADWLSQQTGKQYRLPTEAEWEYAARAGTETKYWWGNEIGSNKANCYEDDCGDNFQYTAPVGSFKANPFGLYDTVGNIWEWICSEYEEKYGGKEQKCIPGKKNANFIMRLLRGSSWFDSPINKHANFRVMRGGSWFNSSNSARAASRYLLSPGHRSVYSGFRVATRTY